ncbi:glycosyltransferase family 32 protein [Infundibulicybe gibba]|nr:glycosyltransferase family 32 protein [Infundibulicybe gibba]
MSSSYHSVLHRPNYKSRYSPGLLTHSVDDVEKPTRRIRSPSWFISIPLLVPGMRTRRLRILVPSPRNLYRLSVSQFGRKRGSLFLSLITLTIIFTTFAFAKRFGTQEKKWPTPFTGEPPTLVFKREDLQRIWKWEIASGHYPSYRKIPNEIGIRDVLSNPALPPRQYSQPSHFGTSSVTFGTGRRRIYPDIGNATTEMAYPPRPAPGSIADLDVVMEHCDFSEKKYVRDCLEILRVGAGLDNGKRLRRGDLEDWKYIFVEQATNSVDVVPRGDISRDFIAQGILHGQHDHESDGGMSKKRGVEWEPPIALRPPLRYQPRSLASCDPEHPRLFHMFWTGPFTDKPYVAILSYLFTQNTGLHVRQYPEGAACRPKFLLWINPGPAASIPNPTANQDMFDQLKSNPWAAPFLHPRFRDVIEFKLWNTTEQLDGVPELKDEWREQETLFNSGGHLVSLHSKKDLVKQTGFNGTSSPHTTGSTTEEDDIVNRTGSKSSSSYDRMSVILSDMARFILCHRFGGIYLDADTIFLRDWEELWGWKGAFAYRWSRLDKYNTAVLKLNKGSALGTFLFRTALKNGLDFHPMTVSHYTKDAHLEDLLLRLPDALFDPAWLNTEYWQRERPPQPYFTAFSDFFEPPPVNSGAPQALGFDGFFKGAFSYHYHNSCMSASISDSNVAPDPDDNQVNDDLRDLPWATVMKRTFEGYIRGERPNLYGEWIQW